MKVVDKVCKESEATLIITIVLLGLACLGMAVVVCTWVTERQIERLRGEREVIASRHGSRDGKIDGAGMPESLVGAKQEKGLPLSV